jgi:U3 small nucleolar ribonucleoprotein protein IMP4
LVLLHEHRGEPDGMIVTHLPLGPTVYFGISGAVLRHDLENRASTMSEAFPHLIFDNFTTALGERLQKIISS